MRLSLVFTFLLFPILVSAQGVVINEIAWMGTPVVGVEEKQWWRYEWLELHSTTVGTVVLDGWTVELSRDPSTSSGQAKIDFKIPLSGTIVSQGYFLIGASDKILNLDLNYKNLSGKFNNSGQRVVLKNNLGEIVDEVDATLDWPAGDNKTKQTMERVGSAVGSVLTTLWQTSTDPGGTPKAPNSPGITRQPDQTKSDLVLQEAETKSDLVLKETEKDPIRSFQSRVPIVNPITLLAGLLALGFSGALLLARRLLASRQERQRS